jgi:DNA primase
MPGIDYHQLRRQITMADVLDLLAFRPTWRRGPQLRGPCPIPGCGSASRRCFSVHLARQVYRCFACHSCGNALDLWVAACGLPLHDAALALCQAADLTPPWSSHCRLSLASRPVASRAPLRNR